METAPHRLRDDFMFLTGCALLTGIVLYIGGAVVRSYEITKGTTTHQRLELIAGNVGNLLFAGVILAAVLAFMAVDHEHRPRLRPLAIVTIVLAGIVVAFAVYEIFDVLTVHIPSLDASDATLPPGLVNGDSLGARIGQVLPALGTLVVAIVALIGANRLGTLLDLVNGSRGTSEHLPEIPEVE